MMLIYLQVLLNTSIRMVMVVEMDLMELSQLASISRVQQQQIMQDTWWWCSRENLVRNCVHMMCEEWISELMRLFSEWADTLKSSSRTSWKKLSRLNTLRLLIRVTGAEASDFFLTELGVSFSCLLINYFFFCHLLLIKETPSKLGLKARIARSRKLSNHT